MLFKLLNQINWKDCLYVGLFNISMKFNLLSILKLDSNLPNYYFILLVFSTTLILAGGNFVRAFFDAKETSIPQKTLLISYLTLFLVANLISFYVRIKINYDLYFIFMLLFTLFVFLYSAEYSFKKTFLNNIVEAFLITFSIILVWWFDPILSSKNHWKSVDEFELVVILFVSLTFIANLVKNLLVDFSTMKTDSLKGLKTLPLVLGEQQAKKFILYVTILIIAVLAYISFFIVKSMVFGFFLLIFVSFPTYYFYKRLVKIKSEKGYLKIITEYYWVTFTGMALIPVISIFLTDI